MESDAVTLKGSLAVGMWILKTDGAFDRSGFAEWWTDTEHPPHCVMPWKVEWETEYSNVLLLMLLWDKITEPQVFTSGCLKYLSAHLSTIYQWLTLLVYIDSAEEHRGFCLKVVHNNRVVIITNLSFHPVDPFWFLYSQVWFPEHINLASLKTSLQCVLHVMHVSILFLDLLLEHLYVGWL